MASKKTPGSGRAKGTPNKATVSLKVAFQAHGPALVKALIELTKSTDEKVRVHAIKECFDRGWGRPAQTIDGNLTGDFTVTWQK